MCDATVRQRLDDSEIFGIKLWFEHDDGPLFTNFMECRICAGSLLYIQELSMIFRRLINSSKVEKETKFAAHRGPGDMDQGPVRFA